MSIALATGAAVVLAAAPSIKQRLELSAAKAMSLSGHVKMARKLGRLVPSYGIDGDALFNADGAPAAVARQRQQGFAVLAEHLQAKAPLSIAATTRARNTLSDLQLTGRNRVPFQFRLSAMQHLKTGSFWAGVDGNELIDLDGNRLLDVTGSYGVNVLGSEFYKVNMAQSATMAAPLGATLGGYQPQILETLQWLQDISGMDEVSFHMSGTEAVMQAVRLARFHTGKAKLVRFAGAYNGWWDDAQPGPGNPTAVHNTYTLKDMSQRTLQVLSTRRDIACVVINPVQALHPNKNAPGDSTLIDGSRQARYDRAAYTKWLQDLRAVCTRRGIVMIMDEVFVGFRLALGGAQSYFNVQADLVCYGKTLGGGYPVGVVCGKKAYMRRYKDDKPGDICFARGTFNAHPHVMAAMHRFLSHVQQPEVAQTYAQLDATWDKRCADFNAAMQSAKVPIKATNMSTIWTIDYTIPSRYHWLMQYYLRDQGLALSWIGTGRLIFNLSFTDQQMQRVTDAFLAAGARMQQDGWWWTHADLTPKAIRKRVMREMLHAKWPRLFQAVV
ncbi:aminotransferase class III-fold pyridoxal phosphate-dependent enzyme [Comamonadaceae bacterium M7527]|nr:aminotransferase class III-fold pyridoxal phosphate-dependent enzyme [Comamonadaceae bacterium M7527]